MRIIVTMTLALMLSGCLARTAIDVVSAPAKIAGKVVDAATTSQSEADEKRGRALRERDERIGKLERKRAKLDAACSDSEAACRDRDDIDDQIRAEMDRPM